MDEVAANRWTAKSSDAKEYVSMYYLHDVVLCFTTAWATIKPKLIQLIEDEKIRREGDEVQARWRKRKHEFIELFHTDYPDGLHHVYGDQACGLPSVRKMLEEDGCVIPVMPERWSPVKLVAEREICFFASRVVAEVGSLAIGADNRDTICMGLDSRRASFQGKHVEPAPYHFDFTGFNPDHAARLADLTPFLAKATTVVKCESCASLVFGANALAHLQECGTPSGLDDDSDSDDSDTDESESDHMEGDLEKHYSWRRVADALSIATSLLRIMGLSVQATSSEVDLQNVEFRCECTFNGNYLRMVSYSTFQDPGNLIQLLRSPISTRRMLRMKRGRKIYGM
jgi:hypothetical protein